MDAPDDPVATPILVATALGGGAQLYSSKRGRDQTADAQDRARREQARLAAADRERKLQGSLGDSIARDRRRERAQQLLTGGRAGTIKTTPIGVMGNAALAGPKYKIGA